MFIGHAEMYQALVKTLHNSVGCQAKGDRHAVTVHIFGKIRVVLEKKIIDRAKYFPNQEDQ
jgi:hypothetical protein